MNKSIPQFTIYKHLGILNQKKEGNTKFKNFLMSPGAIQKSQGGICIFDEIDKSPDTYFDTLKVKKHVINHYLVSNYILGYI